MNTIHFPQPIPPILVIKPTFYNVCLMYDLDYHTLQAIADMAGVQQSIVYDMFTSVVIHRSDALKILAAFSGYTGVNWTFDNVKVALLPTFQDICTAYKLDFVTLTTCADVPCAILDMMLSSEPVVERYARLVLEMVSKQIGQNYTLENVDVKLAVAQ